MKKVFHFLSAFCGVLAMTLVSVGIVLAKDLPDSFSVSEGQNLSFSNHLPLAATCSSSMETIASSKAGGMYKSDLKLFGLVEVKNVTVNVVKPYYVIPGGQVFGIKMYTQGVMVIGMTDVDTKGGPKNPSYEAGIRTGDVLLAIDGNAVTSNQDVIDAFAQSGGKALTVSIKRNNTGMSVSVKAVQSSSDGVYRAGLWVRDSTAGIGTMTFYDPESNIFAGLGHAVCDVDTGKTLPLMSGKAVFASVTNITKGTKGHTGEINGSIGNLEIGNIYENTQTGIYGKLDSTSAGDLMPVAMWQQVHTGKATVLCTLDNTLPKTYSIQIEKVSFDDATPTKNMVIKITDPALIAKTGGIVQGMSGCPIIQDGRIIGAVTHVFVNDPLHGYAIFAENMLKTAKSLEISYNKDVS